MLESQTQLGRACSDALGNFNVSSGRFISVAIFAIRNVKMAPRPWKHDGFCFLKKCKGDISKKELFYVKYETPTRKQRYWH